MKEHKQPWITVDALILDEDKERIVLIRRGIEPYKGRWALPGGFVEYTEKCEEATIREAKEETGLDVDIERLFNVYSGDDRDPRGPSVSVCYICRVVGGELEGGDDASHAEWHDLGRLPNLAFDHDKILNDLKRTLKGYGQLMPG